MPPGPISTSLADPPRGVQCKPQGRRSAVGVADEMRNVDVECVEQAPDHLREVAERIRLGRPP